MSKKPVARWIPNGACDIGRNEAWLREMSAKGLHLREPARRGLLFDRGEPRDLLYRIEVMYTDPTYEQLELYQSCGWEFVTRMSELLCVFAADGQKPVQELHNDTVVQSFAYEKLGKVLRKNVILIAVAVAFIAAMFLGVVVFQEERTLALVTGPSVQNAVLLLVELFVLLTAFGNYRCVTRLRKNLQSGIPINHNQPYKARAAVYMTAACLILLLASVTVVIPLYDIFHDGWSQLPLEHDLPIVGLAELEQNPGMVRAVDRDSQGLDYQNTLEEDWSLLAPDQYDTHEQMIGGGGYFSSLANDYYRLTIPALAGPLLNDLVHRHVIRFRHGTPLRAEVPGLDDAYTFSQGGSHQVFVRRGAQVLHVSYHGGSRSVDRVLELAAQALGSAWTLPPESPASSYPAPAIPEPSPDPLAALTTESRESLLQNINREIDGYASTPDQTASDESGFLPPGLVFPRPVTAGDVTLHEIDRNTHYIAEIDAGEDIALLHYLPALEGGDWELTFRATKNTWNAKEGVEYLPWDQVDFLDEAQKQLYQDARGLLDLFEISVGSDSPQNPAAAVLVKGVPYYHYQGERLPAQWWEFCDLMFGLYTQECFHALNHTRTDQPHYSNVDGKLYFRVGDRGDCQQYSPWQADSYYLDQKSESRIVFYLVGHYQSIAYGDGALTYVPEWTTTKKIRNVLVKENIGWRVSEIALPN